MWNTGFVVADRVLPDVPIRQWVLSTPFELRLLLAANAGAFGALTRIFAKEVLALQRRRARSVGIAGAEGGLLVFQHRFGGSLNLNTHLHAVAVDGVFTRPPAPTLTRALFHRLPAPERAELQGVALRVHRRFVAWLERRGLVRPPDGGEVESSDARRARVERDSSEVKRMLGQIASSCCRSCAELRLIRRGQAQTTRGQSAASTSAPCLALSTTMTVGSTT